MPGKHPCRAPQSAGCLNPNALHSDRWIIVAAAVVALCGFFLGERIPVNDGMGWDGILYAEMARDLPQRLHDGVNSYFIQRMFPAAVVYAGLQLFAAPPTNANLVEAFALLSVVCVLVTAWLWLGIAHALDVSLAGKWFGFAALFLNFGAARQGFYYPILNDMAALALGAAMLLAYLRRRDLALAVLVAVAYFTWAQAAYVGVALLLFPRDPDHDDALHPAPHHLNWLAGIAAAAAASLLFAYGLCGPLMRIHLMVVMLPVSIVLAVIYVLFGVGLVLRDSRVFGPRYLWQRLTSVRFVLTAALILGLQLTVKLLAGEELADKLGAGSVIIGTGIAKPALFFVAHAVYYGPFFLCMFFLWKPVCRLLTSYGTGLPVAVSLGVFLSIGCESRWLMNFLPLLVPFVARAVDALAWTRSQYLAFVGWSLVFSKLYLPLNTDCPAWYFISHGPWMTDFTYGLQGGVVLAAGIYLYRVCRLPALESAVVRPTEQHVSRAA